MNEIPAELRDEAMKWRNLPRRRPSHIETPASWQESVWDYPRPPKVEPVLAEIRVEFAGQRIAASTRSLRVRETANPPVYYIPPDDVRRDLLVPAEQTALCEWKGISRYWHVVVGKRRAENAAWQYLDPWTGFAAITGHLAFNAGKMDACYVDGERVTHQPGDYYGGWITGAIVGPFKGAPGTSHW